MNKSKRLLSLALALLMVISLIPATALAAPNDSLVETTGEQVISTDEAESETTPCSHIHSNECYAAPAGHLCSVENGCVPAYVAGEENEPDAEPLYWECAALELICVHMYCAEIGYCLAEKSISGNIAMRNSPIANENITNLTMMASPSNFQTWVDPNTGLQETTLTVAMNVTVSEDYTNGGTIEIPLDYTPSISDARFDNFTYGVDGQGRLEPFFELITPDAPDQTSIVKSYDTDTKPGTLIIVLKDATDGGFAPGQQMITVRFTFNTNWNSNIPKGMTFWTVNASAYVNGTFAASAAPAAITAKTNYARMTFTRNLYLPTDASQFQGGRLQGRTWYYNNYSFEDLFDERERNILYLEVPTGTTGIPTYFTQNDSTRYVITDIDGSGYDRYCRIVDDSSNTGSDWSHWRSGGNFTTIAHMLDWNIEVPPTIGPGDTFDIRFGAIYTRRNDVQKEDVSKTTYTRVAEKVWDLDFKNVHSTDSATSPSVCGIDDGSAANVGMKLFGPSTAYMRSTYNAGSEDITGVRFEMYQGTGSSLDAFGNAITGKSPKVNFNSVAIYATRESASDPIARYQVEFVIKNALSSVTRTTDPVLLPAMSSTSITTTFSLPSSDYLLPQLSAYEYIDKVIVTPMGVNGLSVGVWPSHNAMTVQWTARAWDNQVWPDGTAVDPYTRVPIGGTLYYDDNPNKPNSYPEDYVRSQATYAFSTGYVYYTNAPYARAALLSEESSGRLPGETVAYQIYGYNNRYSTALNNVWVNPRVTIRVPKIMELVGLEGAALGATTSAYSLNGTSISNTAYVLTTFIGSDANYNYYSFQALDYSAPTSSQESGRVFKIPVEFKISATASPAVYSMGPVLVSSLDAKNFYEMNLTLNGAVAKVTGVSGNMTVNDTGTAYGFDRAGGDNWHVSSLTHTSLEILSTTKITVATSVKSSQTNGEFVKATVVPAGKDEIVEMKITLINDGNADLTSLKLYNILPYAYDALGSTGTIKFLSATPSIGSVQYNTGTRGSTSVPLYGSHGGSALDLQTGFPPGSGWTAATTSGVTAIFVNFGTYILNPGESVEIILKFQVPDSKDQTAYNQFWYSAVEVDNPLSKLNLFSQKGGFSTEAIMITYNANLTTPNLNDLNNLPAARTATIGVDGEGTGKNSLTINATAPTLTGYTFTDWNTQADGSGESYAPGDLHLFDEPGTLALYAQWTRKTVAISYNINVPAGATADAFTPGSGSATALFGGLVGSTSVLPGSYIDPGNPTCAGYVFAGWYDSAAKAASLVGEWVFDTTTINTEGPVTLYAGWTANAYGITYKNHSDIDITNDLPSAYDSAKSYTYGIGLTIPTVEPYTRTGYTFTGWYTAPTSGSEVTAVSSTDAGNKTLYARWQITYTVTYNANSGTGAVPVDSTNYTSGTTVTVLGQGNLEREGYTFSGWQYGINFYDEGDTFTITKDVTLYAIWTKEVTVTPATTYKVTYNANGGTGEVPVDSTNYTSSTTVTVRGQGNLEREGYTFSGWQYGINFYDEGDTFTITKDVTLYAIWTKEVTVTPATTYKVTYNANGGTGEVPVDSTNYTKNTTATVLGSGDLEKTNYSFIGWSTTASGSVGYEAGDDITMTANVELYAVWTPNTYAITYIDHNGNSVTSSLPPSYDGAKSYTYGIGVTIPTATPYTRSSYTFDGWYDAETGGNKVTSINDTDTGNITLYARWTYNGGGSVTPTTYTVKYNANGGTGSHQSTGISSGSKHTVLTLASTGIRRTNYTFTGWNTSASGSGTAYDSGDTITITASVTLYAQWTYSGGSGRDPSNPYDDIIIIGEEDVPLGSLEDIIHIRYLNGYPNDSVKPESAITRAEAASIFYRLLKETYTDGKASTTFSDVSSDAWYSLAVSTLAEAGILSGYPDGTFKPDQPITRAEFATIASKFDSLILTSGTAFSDVPGTYWAAQYINSAYVKGWIDGYSDYSFKPGNSISRAEVVTIVNNMLNRAIDDAALLEITNPYNDISSSHWSYADIIEASKTHEYERDSEETEIWQTW